MSRCWSCLFLTPLVIIGLVSFYFVYVFYLMSPPPLPTLDLEEWWGPTESRVQDTSVRPFTIRFEETMVKDLKQRLKSHRSWTPGLQGVGFQYGFNHDQLPEWITYWAEQYNFTEREKFLNQFPQYKTKIQGLDIHFIRVKPKFPDGTVTVPMLFMHGWPGSVREFYEALPLLTAISKDRDFAIEAIIPSLPGYCFSDAPIRPGLGAAQVAIVLRNLMRRLGFKTFYIQGGDWGSLIGAEMATIFPEEILGFHNNLPVATSSKANLLTLLGSLYPPLIVDSHLQDRMYPLSKIIAYQLEEFGYSHIQATKPDTLGVGLSDSPTGLLAYILEKFSTWTRTEYRGQSDGGLGMWDKDKLLDNIMLYWSNGCITSSMRFYAENNNVTYWSLGLSEIPTPVPMWGLQAKNEITYQPPAVLRFKYPNLLRTNPLEVGGHFIALELPELFAKDVLTAVAEFRSSSLAHLLKYEL
ncbi:juvenile hormone epoxide hydrolase-like isoform X1 [Cydia pomonella]|uniref:juvenile hormone epoxide hydrolase-like isoform X1 n=2 Tax=Cydia pomonella TaxID=82600 RepID=UPI002ADD9FEB|nr:juvenile hormone epoxide hydrolase-like isoform X1 [Cydia pomonella]XP_061705569.1 juvenile hormone epoxide hydrolase-like isoform X1 [Cydia pomonella]